MEGWWKTMINLDLAYICDCCGKKYTIPSPTIPINNINGEACIPRTEVDFSEYHGIPNKWKNMPEPFGLCCDKCMAEFMGVYERIHAPEKARQIYEENGYGR